MPGKQARALCPVCQEPMAPDATDCGNCGAFVIDEAVVRLSRAFGIDREKALALFEAGFRRPEQLRGRDVNGVLERKETGLLFLCTNCGGFVATGDTKCPRCGAEFEEDEEAEPAWPGEAADILDLVLCPNCGADNTSDWTECEICGQPLREETAGVKPGPPPQVPRDLPKEPGIPVAPSHEGAASTPIPDRLPPIGLHLEEKPTPRTQPKPTEARKVPPKGRPMAPPPVPARPAAPPVVLLPPPAQVPGPQAPEPGPVPGPTAARPATARTERPLKKPAEIRLDRLRRARPRTSRAARSRAAPPDLAGPAILGAAGSLIVSAALRIDGMFWALAFLVTGFAGLSLARLSPADRTGIGRRAGLFLVLGATAGALGPFAYGASMDAAYVLAVAGIVPVVAAARTLLDSPHRSLLAVAGAIPLISLAVVAGQGLPDAARIPWHAGVLAALVGPVAALLGRARERGYTIALRRELAQAERHLAQADYAQSAETYDRAIALAKGSPAAAELPWYGKGASLVLLGRYEEALRAIDRALDLNPRNEVAWVNKGNAYTKMGSLVDALRCFNAAIKVNPRYEVAWNNKGNALARLGRHEDALRCYDAALEIDPNYRVAWVNKGYVLAKLGRYDEAASCADRVLRMRGARAEPG